MGLGEFFVFGLGFLWVWLGLFVFVLGFLWVWLGLFVFYEACSPLPMGEGPGVRSGFRGAFVFGLGLSRVQGEGFWS